MYAGPCYRLYVRLYNSRYIYITYENNFSPVQLVHIREIYNRHKL